MIYVSPVFTLDTDTNIAGLTAVKGSAPNILDYVCIKSGATITIESSVGLAQINVGYTGINATGPDSGHLVINADVTLTLPDESQLAICPGSDMVCNGTIRDASAGPDRGAPVQSPSAYSTVADITGLIPQAVLIELTDDERTGSYSLPRIFETIAQADSEINAYCATKFTVPLFAFTHPAYHLPRLPLHGS